MTHQEALDSAVEAFKAALKEWDRSMTQIDEHAFVVALEHYRIARGEDDG